MTDSYEKIRKALEGLRERCAQEVERITARRRMVAAMTNNEAVKPCEVAAAIRKIDAQQHYECAARQVEQLAEALREARQMIRDLRMGLRYAVRVWVLSDEIEWSEAEIDEVVESIISDAKEEKCRG